MNALEDTVDIGQMITRTPGIKGGAPHVASSGVTVATVVRWHRLGLPPEDIARRTGHLSVGQIHAALAYYYANQAAMDQQISDDDAESERIERHHAATQPHRR